MVLLILPTVSANNNTNDTINYDNNITSFSDEQIVNENNTNIQTSNSYNNQTLPELNENNTNIQTSNLYNNQTLPELNETNNTSPNTPHSNNNTTLTYSNINMDRSIFSISDSDFSNSPSASTFTIKTNSVFISSDFTLNHKGLPFVITLKDVYGNVLTGQTITITVHGVTYTRTTDNNGRAKLNINFNPGTYSISFTYAGTATYNPSTGTRTIYMISDNTKLSSSINAEDVIEYCGEGKYYQIHLYDNNGQPLSSASLTITVNGVTYSRTTNSDGMAQLQINLPEGTYTITTTYNGNTYYYSSSHNGHATVNKHNTTLYGQDLSKYYGDTTPYSVTLTNSNGDLLTNYTISLTIHGVTYTRNTDSNGIARLNINLHEGTYIISSVFSGDAYYHGSNQVNNVIIIKKTTTLTSNGNLQEYYGEGKYYTVTLKDNTNTPLIKNITIRVNGAEYLRTTNNNGQANLQINLPPGTYNIQATYNGDDYYASSSCSNTVNVNKIDTYITSSNLVEYYGEGKYYAITLKDHNNQPLVKEVIISVNGVNYSRTTDSNGQTSLKINLPPGTYNIITNYNGDNYYSASSSSKLITVNKKTTSLTSNGDLTLNYGSIVILFRIMILIFRFEGIYFNKPLIYYFL